jgi:prepilin-type N-terminal cleavage/methylation domain-containing protein
MWCNGPSTSGAGPCSFPARGRADHQRAAPFGFFGRKSPPDAGVTLVELLCVVAIIAILASLLFPAILYAYNRVKGWAEEMDAPIIANLLVEETRRFCAANPQYSFSSKSEFADKCLLAPKCRNWVQAPTTEFVPFNYLTPTNKIVLAVHIGWNHATLYAFSKGELSTPSERR